MRHKGLLVLLTVVASTAHAAAMSRAEVISTFKYHEALNAEFLSAVKFGRSTGGRSYESLRKELEEHSDGPLEVALESSVSLVCDEKDNQVVRSLMNLILAIQKNSANESPDYTLGRVFMCQPEVVSNEFRGLPKPKQSALYPGLEFGFDNARIDHPLPNVDTGAIDAQLKALSPEQAK